MFRIFRAKTAAINIQASRDCRTEDGNKQGQHGGNSYLPPKPTGNQAKGKDQFQRWKQQGHWRHQRTGQHAIGLNGCRKTIKIKQLGHGGDDKDQSHRPPDYPVNKEQQFASIQIEGNKGRE